MLPPRQTAGLAGCGTLLCGAGNRGRKHLMLRPCQLPLPELPGSPTIAGLCLSEHVCARMCVRTRVNCVLSTHVHVETCVSTDAHLCLGPVHTPQAHLPLKVHFTPRDVPSLPARVLPRGEASISPAEAASHSALHSPLPCASPPQPSPSLGPASSPGPQSPGHWAALS